MPQPPLIAVTGAYGYTGRYIAQRLLADGATVRTLTRNPPSASPFGDQVQTRPLDFTDPDSLADSLRGADTLYNTYWIRFARGNLDHDTAVRNSRSLIDAAVAAGVRRIVHISITGASPDSPLPYFRGKGLVENHIRDTSRQSSLSWAILRPTVIFGREDILINNIAWFLRRFPLFPIPGQGDYPVQPVYVDDVARLSVETASSEGNATLDAVGPETFTFKELVQLIGQTAGGRARPVPLPPPLVFAAARLMGLALRDVVLTRDEIAGLTAGHLASTDPPTATTRLSDWLRQHRPTLGRRYASELARHYRQTL